LAFLGLASAGLDTLFLAPLAALWAMLIWVTHPLSRADKFRVLLIWETGIGLLCLVIGASILALADRAPNTLFIGGLLLFQSSLTLPHLTDLWRVLQILLVIPPFHNPIQSNQTLF
jgi:hypothetical protein